MEKENKNEEQMEYCVLCGMGTGVKLSEPIGNGRITSKAPDNSAKSVI